MRITIPGKFNELASERLEQATARAVHRLGDLKSGKARLAKSGRAKTSHRRKRKFRMLSLLTLLVEVILWISIIIGLAVLLWFELTDPERLTATPEQFVRNLLRGAPAVVLGRLNLHLTQNSKCEANFSTGRPSLPVESSAANASVNAKR